MKSRGLDSPVGIGFHLAMDGLSLLLVLLSVFLGLAAVVASWTEIESDVGFFHFNLMATLPGIIGVFIAMDLFLFYFFWELMLVPMYFLIALWGHERTRLRCREIFPLHTVRRLADAGGHPGSLFYPRAGRPASIRSIIELLGTPWTPGRLLRLILLGFLAAFLVKLPGRTLSYVASRCPHGGPHGGERHSRRSAAENRGVRHPPLCCSLLPGASIEFAPLPWRWPSSASSMGP